MTDTIATPASTPRKPFTDITWAQLGTQMAYLTPQYPTDHRLSWTHNADLAHELRDRHPNITDAMARSLVMSATSGLPIVMKWANSDGDTTETVVIVDYMGRDMLHVRYVGFAHPVYVDRISEAHAFEAKYQFISPQN